MNRQMRTYGDGAVERVKEQVRSTREAREDGGAGGASVWADDDTEEPRAAAKPRVAGRRQTAVRLAEQLRQARAQMRSMSAAQTREEEALHAVNVAQQATIDALTRTNAELAHLIESTEVGTLVLDRTMRIRGYTPALVAVFDIGTADRGGPLARMRHRLDYAGLVEDVRRAIESKERIEREVRSDTGKSFIVRIGPTVSLVGKIDGAVLTFIDHTAQHRVEEELREAQAAAESADLRRRNLLEVLAHDLRGPLTAIMILADSLRSGAALTLDQERRVAGISVGGRHLASMIDGIVGVARRNGSQDVVDRQIVDARVLAGEVHALMGPASEAKGLMSSLDVPDESVMLEIDVGIARRVLINLCENAVKYTDVGRVGLRVGVEQERVIFEVSDTGIGISAEDQHRIFDRLWQAESQARRGAGGMGIGLTAARENGRLLGGDVEVESEPGQGSTFRFWLPRVWRSGRARYASHTW